ncbi:hypothetical protein [Streptomyces syringium]|uniref:imine reductase family protein n=1 Tax=Streptomyces syringium TaxID=76729 RepID=UPI003F52A73F
MDRRLRGAALPAGRARRPRPAGRHLLSRASPGATPGRAAGPCPGPFPGSPPGPGTEQARPRRWGTPTPCSCTAVRGKSSTITGRRWRPWAAPRTSVPTRVRRCALEHIARTSVERNVSSDQPKLRKELAERAIAEGRGGQNYLAVCELLKKPTPSS